MRLLWCLGAAGNGTYEYDLNGNLKKDSRRGLEYGYNSLNLLSEVRRDGQPAAKYDWLADGTKLGVKDRGGNGFVYAGSLIYRRSADGLKLETAHFGDGVIRVNENGTQEVDYFICDHLGSVRMIVDSAGAVKERNDYYPFGARHVRSDYALSTNRWKYNGKELQVTGNLGFLDYGARIYDMSIGRWFGMDPLAEEYTALSGYVFSGNNPLILVDVDGQYFDWYQNAAGTAMLWKDSKEEELLINGEVYNNVGSSMSLEVDGLYFNYYQNILASTSSEPLNGMESVLSNPSLLPKLLGSNSALSETYQLELLVRSMHNAQDAFLNHPVTQGTISLMFSLLPFGSNGFVRDLGLGKDIGFLERGNFAQRLFLSEKFGITSAKFANSVTFTTGSFNKAGSFIKAGWSTTMKGGYKFRIGVGNKGNKALFHFYLPKTYVPNSFANPGINIKRSLFKLNNRVTRDVWNY